MIAETSISFLSKTVEYCKWHTETPEERHQSKYVPPLPLENEFLMVMVHYTRISTIR